MDSRIPERQLAELVSWTLSERLRCWWYELRMTIREMNYASWCLIDPAVPMPAATSRLDESAGQG